MVLLMLFAFIAGAATAVSPCALPVLPVVFAAGVTGGRKRPLGIALGLAVSFTFAVVVLVYVLSALGLPDSILRTFAIAVLLVFGLSLVLPKVADRVEFQISKMTSRGAGKVAGATQKSADGKDGFWSGFLVGAGLGFVYAPCAGPILAGVITATASQEFSSQRLLVALAYGLGSAITFFVLMIGGRKLIAPLMQRSQRIQMAMGLSMVFVAFAMFANLDTRFQTEIASALPSAIVNPTGGLEKSEAVSDDLAAARGSKSRFAGKEAGKPSNLPVLGTAPDFVGNERWFNTASGEPLTLRQLRGKVVLVDFWTYTCINCIRTQPYLKSWYSKYKDKGFVIVGVHTPEFPFERKAGNVQDAIKQAGITYPVAQDNAYKTWDAYSNEYWPAHYLIDAKGRVRATHFGEGEYKRTEAQIRGLLAEAGKGQLGGEAKAKNAVMPSKENITPETYLGAARAQGFVNGTISPGAQNFGAPPSDLPASTFAYSGRWRIDDESATALSADSRIDANFHARRVYLVLGSPGRTRSVSVELDGRPLKVVKVRDQKLYNLVDLQGVEDHRLTLRVAPGVTGFAFTFG
ncbi:MAG: cytochrome c biogenesis protein DipZ [Thermoleophilaceae bacterium]|nr:cytochrome c biogenesis protein DipZ [Thermoleophilaceae bacterium]